MLISLFSLGFLPLMLGQGFTHRITSTCAIENDPQKILLGLLSTTLYQETMILKNSWSRSEWPVKSKEIERVINGFSGQAIKSFNAVVGDEDLMKINRDFSVLLVDKNFLKKESLSSQIFLQLVYINEIIKKIEAERNFLINYFSSNYYLNKVQKEFSCDSSSAQEIVSARIFNTRKVLYLWKNTRALGGTHSKTTFLAGNKSQNEVYIVFSRNLLVKMIFMQKTNSQMFLHEFIHASVINNLNLSNNFRLLSGASFTSGSSWIDNLKNIPGEERESFYAYIIEGQYLGDPAEKYVRRLILELELFQKGFYNGNLNLNQYKIIRSNFEEKKFSRNSMEFLLIIKFDFVNLKKILDEIS
jgi:hypothetical protein